MIFGLLIFSTESVLSPAVQSQSEPANMFSLTATHYVTSISFLYDESENEEKVEYDFSCGEILHFVPLNFQWFYQAKQVVSVPYHFDMPGICLPLFKIFRSMII